ncbi:MAG TPA: hypothetical protein VIH42_11295, partial [Thermoguttaceae bacterium]
AIGTIIGGVATAPFVIYAWKASRTVKPPRGKFEKEWASIVKMLDVPIKEIDGPSTFTLDYHPKIGDKFRVISLYAGYDENSYPAEYPELPEHYYISNGQLTQISPIINDRPALLISVEKQTVRARNYHDEHPGGEYVIIPRKDNDELEFFEVGQGVYKKISRAKVNIPCILLAMGLTFQYPKGKPLERGMKWTIPETSHYNVELPCEIVGFAQVVGRETVKIKAERHLNNQEVQHFITYQMQQVKKIEKERGSNYDADAAMKREVKEAIEEEETRAWKVTCYVDLESGITVRQEFNIMTHSPKVPKKDTTSLFITQVLEG